MKTIRKLRVFSLSFLLAAALLSQSANAALISLVEVLLPESSYAGDTWQGYRVYNEPWGDDGTLYGRIDFAVYDADNLQSTEEREFVEGLDMPGQYIYAYQIFNKLPPSDETVAYFSVFAINGAPLDVYTDSINSYEDPDGGVEATEEYFTSSNLEAVWKFDEGFIYKGDHSWFLAFSSDSEPVAGNYEIRGPEEGGQFPAPEPSTVALFGLGGAMLMLLPERRRTVW